MAVKTVPSKEVMQNGILSVEKKLSSMEGAKFGDDCAPLKHSFGDGLYIRQITMPADMLLVSKIHKKKHPYFILKGECSVLTDEGVVRLKAPYSGITMPGTKRILYMHTETVWVTVHRTDHTDLKKIEEEIIAKSFDEIPTEEEIKKLKEAKL